MTRKNTPFFVLYLAAPLTMLSSLSVYYYFIHIHPDTLILGLFSKYLTAFMLSSILFSSCFFLWEKKFPLEYFETNKRQTANDIIYAVISGVVLASFHHLIIKAPSLHWGVQQWPVGIQFLIGWAFNDLLLYWWHRAVHESGNDFLWKLHKLHHAPERLNFFVSARTHLGEIFYLIITLFITKILFGFSAEIMMWILICPAITGALHHTNVDFRLGIFNYIIPGPEMHRVHHDQDLDRALNYSPSFPIWDLLFGTAKPLQQGHQIKYGLKNHDDENPTYWQELIPPFQTLNSLTKNTFLSMIFSITRIKLQVDIIAN